MNNSRKSTTIYLLSILFILISLPSEAIAGIFDPATTDKSIEYLGMIFGDSIGNIHLGGSTNSNSFLSNLFQIFNSIILAVAVIILSYVSTISTVNTAQEGQVMGKKWSSVWIPLRSAVGLLLLAPVPGSGYSSLQVLIMWVVLNGVGAADKMWDFVLDNLAQGISATQKAEINKEDITTLSKNGTALAKDLFNSLVCINILNESIKHNHATTGAPYPVIAGIAPAPGYPLDHYFEGADPPIPIANSVSQVLKFGINDPGIPARQNICGEIEIAVSLDDTDLIDQNNHPITPNVGQKNQILNWAFRLKKQAIVIMINHINPIAEEIAKIRPTPTNDIILPHHITNTPGLLYKAISEYQKSMSRLTKQKAMNEIGIHISADKQSISEAVITQGKAFGWITAGSYYYLLSQGTLQNLLSTATESLTIKEPLYSSAKLIKNTLQTAAFGVTSAQLQNYMDAIANKHRSISNLFNPPTELAISGNQPIKLIIPYNAHRFLEEIKTNNHAVAPFIESFLNFNETALKDIQHRLSDNHDDPLLSQAMFGVKLMQAAEEFWVSIVMGSFVSNTIATMFTGSAGISFLSLIIGLLPVILVFGGMIWTIGATFAVYTPMVPYMMFVVTALGWFTLVIEAIVAAPIVALGLITPAQDELGKVVPALGIMANVFLRPVLMVVGLIMAAKLYSTIISMVNLGFKFSFATLQQQTGTSMFSWIVMLILYSGFIVTLVNKCYALIYQLPDKVLRWIGVSGEQTDISSVKETQQSFDQGAKQGIAPLEGVATGAAGKLKEHVQAATKKDGSGLGHGGPGG